MTGLNLYNNGAIKTIDFSPWGGIDGFLNATGGGVSDVLRLRKLVPWLNKAITMTSNAVSQLPYCIEASNEVEIDKELAWGGVRNPQTIISLVAASLCGGSAYCLVETTSRAVVSLQYITPQTMTPIFDSNGEVTGFKRQLQSKTQILSPEQVLYFWLPDDTVEAGPAQLTPIVNATLPASLMAAMDGSLRQYGERGFIPPTLLSAKGMPNKSDAERTERWWNAFLRGWTNTVAKIINAETMTATTLGAGMDELRGSYIEITNQQIKNIAASFGIPNSTFISDENSYATALSDIKLWYTSSEFVRIYQAVEDTLSDQLWNRFGWQMEYEPEKLEAFQQEETDKSSALSTLSAAFATNPEASIIAADVLGYDLSDEQKLAIEALGEEEEAEPVTEEVTDDEQVDEVEPVMPSEEDNLIAAEMMTWRKFCEKPRKREFEVKHIPSAMAIRINAGLHAAKSQDEIQAVFDAAALDLPILTLARAIERAA